MLFTDLTFSRPAENLAFDEAVLNSLEQNDFDSEVLRVWQVAEPLIVVGRSGRVQQEVAVGRATADRVPIMRRSSGGGAVVVSKGCLLYSLALSMVARPELRMLDRAHEFVMGELQAALQSLVPDIEFKGTCDLTLGGRKFSGNSLKVARDHLLYHGTFLLDMDLELVSSYLAPPPKQPDYRENRAHADFVTNLNLPADQITSRLRQQFQADQRCDRTFRSQIDRLVEDKYDNPAWLNQR